MRYYFSVLNLYNKGWYYIKGRSSDELLEIDFNENEDFYKSLKQGEYTTLDEKSFSRLMTKLRVIVYNELGNDAHAGSDIVKDYINDYSWVVPDCFEALFGEVAKEKSPEDSYQDMIDDGYVFKVQRIYKEKGDIFNKVIIALSFNQENF